MGEPWLPGAARGWWPCVARDVRPSGPAGSRRQPRGSARLLRKYVHAPQGPGCPDPLGGVYEGNVGCAWGEAVRVRKPCSQWRRDQPTGRLGGRVLSVHSPLRIVDVCVEGECVWGLSVGSIRGSWPACENRAAEVGVFLTALRRSGSASEDCVCGGCGGTPKTQHPSPACVRRRGWRRDSWRLPGSARACARACARGGAARATAEGGKAAAGPDPGRTRGGSCANLGLLRSRRRHRHLQALA